MADKTIHSAHSISQILVNILEVKGIKNAVVSSGSRNAPLTVELFHSSLECYSIIDERSAAFFAMGMARQKNSPVALVCTSGSAVLNYYPAVAEAYYSRIPLIVLSADRPTQWTDQAIGQTIRQDHVLVPHTVYSTTLREGSDLQTIWFNTREINLAVNAALEQMAPVHINLPFSEPLYETTEEEMPLPKIIESMPVEASLSEESRNEIARIWKTGRKKMILIGCHRPDAELQRTLEKISRDSDTAILCETTSNMPSADFVTHIDQAIIPLSAEQAKDFQPDVLVTCGGMVVSKKIKSFLQQAASKAHIHVSLYTFPDTYMSLTHCAKTDDISFFKMLSEIECKSDGYRNTWDTLKKSRIPTHKAYCEAAPYSDFKTWEAISQHLPKNTHLEIANSAAIRYSQLFPLPADVTVNCNRGTSGIDGSSSTAAGAAVALFPKQVTLVTGDLSFFYDNNAFWNAYLPASMRVIVLNNGGGGIFRILDGARTSDICPEYLEACHDLSAESIAHLHRLEYAAAHNPTELRQQLSGFWNDSARPKLLEVFTQGIDNGQILRDYFSSL